MTVEHTIVKAGEGLLAVAARLSPAGITGKQKAEFAAAISVASNIGYNSTIYAGQVLHYDTAKIPVVGTPPPPPPPPTSGTFPTAETTGVPAGISLQVSSVRRSSSVQNWPTKTVDGKVYLLFKGLQFNFGTDYFYCDAPYQYFENCKFISSGLVSNTSAMVQASSAALNGIIFDHCTFDGGPYHNRNAQSDYGLKAIACNNTRFGNAAFEMNNRGGNADMEIRDCYLYEPVGWQPADHTDGIQVGGGRNVTIVNNTVLVTSHNTDGGVSNSTLGLWAELGNVTGTVLVDHNRLAGGGRIMYLEQKSPYSWQGQVTVQNNQFDKLYEPHGGIWGILYPSGLPSKLTWQNNVWNDGTPVSLADAKATY